MTPVSATVTIVIKHGNEAILPVVCPVVQLVRWVLFVLIAVIIGQTKGTRHLTNQTNVGV